MTEGNEFRKVTAIRTMPVGLHLDEDLKRRFDEMFERSTKLVRFLKEFCKRTIIVRGRDAHEAANEVQKIVYDFCKKTFKLQSEVIIQQIRQVCETFTGCYDSRHIPKIDENNFPIRLTHGKKHMFYLEKIGDTLYAKISLPNGERFRKFSIRIHRFKEEDSLSELLNLLPYISDSVLTRDYKLHLTFTKKTNLVEVDGKEGVIQYYSDDRVVTPVGVDVGAVNLFVACLKDGKVVYKAPYAPIEEAHKRGVEHRRLKQKLGSKKFTYHEKDVIEDYVRMQVNKLIREVKKIENPVIVLEGLKYLNRKLRRLHHTKYLLPYRILQEVIREKANWNDIPVQFVRANYSSLECPKCGKRGRRVKNYRVFVCSCGFERDADEVGAVNLAKRFRNSPAG